MALTKAARIKAARSVRAALSQYMNWLDPHIAAAIPDRDPAAQQLGWLINARDELNDLIAAEQAARAAAPGEGPRKGSTP